MRALIAIGCDIYEKPPLSTLAGAENDARAVYEHLVSSGWGGYDESSSKLLLSPTIAELKSELENVLFSADVIEELTIFFAGHGGVKDGSYFLCLRDTDVDRMSFNALAMTQLFAWITEAKVGHTNVIIDACESGGVVHDIGVLLNPNVIGKAGSLAVSILAASGSDEYAQETGGAGLCTTALMSCLRGDTVVQTTRPSLDLVEVGQVVSRMRQGKLQTPVSWGINLFGVSQLSKNPCYAGGNAYIAEAFPGLTGDGAGNEHIRAASEAIWEQYLLLSREFDADSFLDVVIPVSKLLEGEPAMAAGFVEGLSSAFGARGAAAEDAFEAARVHAACAVALLPLAGPDGPVSIAIQSLATKVVHSINEGISHLLAKLNESKYSLLGPNSGLADFYFLPIRVASVLGWVGAAFHLDAAIGSASFHKEDAAELVRLVVLQYSGSLVPVSDEIAPFYVSFASAAPQIGCMDELEAVSGLFLKILHERRGRLAYPGLTGEEAFRFVTAAAEGNYDDCGNLLANPTSLLAATLLVFGKMELSDLADGAMRAFDRTYINFFIPNDYRHFGDGLVEDGINFSFNVGHAIFSIADVMEQWSAIKEKLDTNASLDVASVRIASVLASLLRPDRQAWFLLRDAQLSIHERSIQDSLWT